MPTDDDTFSNAGAWLLAGRIRAYWTELGYPISVWVEEAKTLNLGDHTCWCVRSDLVNGFPRGAG